MDMEPSLETVSIYMCNYMHAMVAPLLHRHASCLHRIGSVTSYIVSP